jgi:hypothetical protein
MRISAGPCRIVLFAVSLVVVQCGPSTSGRSVQTLPTRSSVSLPPVVQGTRTAWVRTLSAGCNAADLELVLPFYEGLRLKPASVALRAAKSESLELAYPGPLSMPLLAWRCGDAEWTAVIPAKPTEAPARLLVRTTRDDLEARMECFGICTFQEVHARGPWNNIAAAVAEVRLAPPLPARRPRGGRPAGRAHLARGRSCAVGARGECVLALSPVSAPLAPARGSMADTRTRVYSRS